MIVESVRGALGLLTRIPIGTVAVDRPGAAAFGIVGGAVGVIGAIPLVLLAGAAGEPWLGAIAAIAAMVVTTGALHLDGLADTADALLARDPEAAERARKDPAIGAGGAIALLLAIGAEVASLASIAGVNALAAGASLVSVAAVSRAVPVLAVRATWTPADEAGLGQWFRARASTLDVVVALASAVLIVALAGGAIAVVGEPTIGWLVVAGAALGFVVASAGTVVVVAARGGLDGDGMGAAIEVSMVAGLAATAILVV